MSNLETVQDIYAAFARGDIDAILDRLADDVSWDDWPDGAPEGVPWLVTRRGRGQVAEFFAGLGALEFERFEPVKLIDGGDDVVAVIDVELTVRETGARIVDSEIHLWSFDADGNVRALRHYLDTAKHVAAARAPARS